jgi:hypothetical protein
VPHIEDVPAVGRFVARAKCHIGVWDRVTSKLAVEAIAGRVTFHPDKVEIARESA